MSARKWRAAGPESPSSCTGRAGRRLRGEATLTPGVRGGRRCFLRGAGLGRGLSKEASRWGGVGDRPAAAWFSRSPPGGGCARVSGPRRVPSPRAGASVIPELRASPARVTALAPGASGRSAAGLRSLPRGPLGRISAPCGSPALALKGCGVDLERLQWAGHPPASLRQTCGHHHQETDFGEKQWAVSNLGRLGRNERMFESVF